MAENPAVKRPLDASGDHLDGVKAVLLDIEGTTTPISFVKDKLISYFRENVKTYLETHFEQEETQNVIKELRELATKDAAEEKEGAVAIPEEEQEKIIEAVINYVFWQIDNERKTTPLKKIQGYIWREAYKTGKVQGELYEDVLPAIKSFIAEQKKVYTYSFGTVEAQKLLFKHSTSGDVAQHFEGHFDTEIGDKKEKESYVKIAKQIEFEPDQVLFVTDIADEAKAAAQAGFKTVMMMRDEVKEDGEKTFVTAKSFSELVNSEVDGNQPKRQAVEENGDGAKKEAESEQTEDAKE